jgi:hypothetical protein
MNLVLGHQSISARKKARRASLDPKFENKTELLMNHAELH